MSNISCLFDTISSGGFDRAMTTLYGEQNLPHQRERWCRLLEQYNELFADSDTHGCSAHPDALKSAATTPTISAAA